MQVAPACLDNVFYISFGPWRISFLPPVCSDQANGDTAVLTLEIYGFLTDGAYCLFCKESVEDVSRFFFGCSEFRDNFESVC